MLSSDKTGFAKSNWIGVRTLSRLKPILNKADKQRIKLENRYATRIGDALQEMLRKSLRSEKDVPNLVQRMRETSGLLKEQLLEMYTAASNLGVEVGQTLVETAVGMPTVKQDLPLNINWAMANVHVLEWAARESEAIFAELLGTNAKELSAELTLWLESGAPLSDLKKTLSKGRWFGKARGKMIAVTEVTRAYNEGNMAAYRESGVVTGKEFQTARDEHVCSICAPLDGKITELEGTFETPFGIENFQKPPVHVNCRCVLAPITRRFQRV